MSRVNYQTQWYPLEAEESVLDGLLRQGVAVPHACKAGVCQSCLMRASGGTVPEKAQVGLKDTLKARNYFLACSCQLEQGVDLEVAGGDELRVSARLEALEPLSAACYLPPPERLTSTRTAAPERPRFARLARPASAWPLRQTPEE